MIMGCFASCLWKNNNNWYTSLPKVFRNFYGTYIHNFTNWAVGCIIHSGMLLFGDLRSRTLPLVHCLKIQNIKHSSLETGFMSVLR